MNSASIISIKRGRRRGVISEKIIENLFLSASVITVLAVLVIIFTLVSESLSFFLQISPREFFLGTQWTAFFEDRSFGVLPLLSGTILTSTIALLFAVPTGVGSAIFLSEYSSERVRRIVKPTLEVLAGIPTVVYGYFALYFITPNLRTFIPDISIFNALSAGLAVGVMILPTVASLSEDAIYAVPQNLKEVAYALGGRKVDAIVRVIIPYALPAILSAIIIAMARVIGETMIVTIAAGLKPSLTLNPFESVMTMTAAIAQAATGDAPHGTVQYSSLFAVGTYLFVIVMILNSMSHLIRLRWSIKL
ncbi:MAG: phosphate ABC transporter permease subunit PstC [Nitrososphaerota archaeon]|nr:phosphate ABC transporter permease subunit PstC [Nitrososphaerales archaeon]MDW8044554.1 phosphate ABC transporter permease subunit PstC [Nitrososphaerota archaeon]